MAQIQAYLHLNGNCREAMTFYKECLGGELVMQAVGETPMADQMPAAMHNNILHAQLTREDFVLMATDMMGPAQAIKGSTISLLLNCRSEEEVRTLFASLAVGGEVGHPLEETFWGATFGDLTDRFGVNWMFNFDKNQQA